MNPLPMKNRPPDRRRPGMVLVVVVVVIALVSLGAYRFVLQQQAEHESARLEADRVQAVAVARSGQAALESVLRLSPAQREAYGGLYHNSWLAGGLVVDGSDAMRPGRFFIISPRLPSDDEADLPFPSAFADPGQAAASDDGPLAAADNFAEGMSPAPATSGSQLAVDAADLPLARLRNDSRGASFPPASGMSTGQANLTSPAASGSEPSDVSGTVRAGRTRYRFGCENESAKLNLASLLEWEKTYPGAARWALLQLPGMDEATADSILDWIDKDDQPREFGAENDFYQTLTPPYSPTNELPATLDSLLAVRGVTAGKLYGNEEDDTSFSGRRIPWCRLLTTASAERSCDFWGRDKILLNQGDLSALHGQLRERLDERIANFVIALRQMGPYEGNDVASADGFTADLTRPAAFDIESILDLLSAKVNVGTKDEPHLLGSPFGTAEHWHESFVWFCDTTTTSEQKILTGRVNLRYAAREVLAAIPAMDAVTLDAILAARQPIVASALTPNYSDPTWLVTQQIVNLERFRKLQPYLTMGGDLFQAQIIGSYGPNSPAHRALLMLDATETDTRQIYYVDLSRRGLPDSLREMWVSAFATNAD